MKIWLENVVRVVKKVARIGHGQLWNFTVFSVKVSTVSYLCPELLHA